MVDSYVDGYYPQSVFDTIVGLQGEGNESAPEEWLSVPRSMDSDVTEVIRYEFGMPASISALTFDVKRIGVRFEVWYKSRQGTVQPLLQSNRREVAYNVIADEEHSWATYNYEIYPVIATEIEFRIVRRKTALSPTDFASVGLKNVLIKRSVTARRDASAPLPDMVDAIGNTVTNVVQDWGADRAFDDEPYTFWKSEPQPYPDGVVSLYVDTRDDEGDAQWIDHFFLDPVTSGQQLNVYYSNDDTQGPNIVSESVVNPRAQENVSYEQGKGLLVRDVDANIEFDGSKIDFDHTKSHWIGLQWTPTYDSTTSRTAYLFSYGDFSLYHDNNSLSLVRGSEVRSLDLEFVSGQTFNIVVGLNMESDTDLQGIYLAYTEDGDSDYSVLDERGKALFEGGEFSAFLDGEPVALEDYFTSQAGRYAPIKDKLSPGQVVELRLNNDGVGHSGVKKNLAFYARSDNRYGGIKDGYPAALPQVRIHNANGDIASAVDIPHTATELVPNPLLDDKGAQLGTHLDVGAPHGNASAIGLEPVYFDMLPYITAKAGEVLFATFVAKTTYGNGRITPILDSGDYDVERYNTVQLLDNGWAKFSCVLSINSDIEGARLGYFFDPTESMAVNDGANAYVSAMSLVRNTIASPHTVIGRDDKFIKTELDSTLSAKSLSVSYEVAPGTWSITMPRVTTAPSDGSYEYTDGLIRIGDLGGYLSAFIVKQEPLQTGQADSFLQHPDVYTLPDPVDSTGYGSSLSNAILVGRLAWEEVFRGGVDGSKYSAKKWIPVYSDWTVKRQWYYLPQATKMKYLKLEFSNLVMEPYPIWEDGVKTTYQVFPLSVTEISKRLATLDTTHKTETTTTGTTSVETTNTSNSHTGKEWTHTNEMHDNHVSQISSSSSTYSEVSLPKDYEIEVQKPITTSFPPDSGIRFDQEFSTEVANSAIYKGSTQQTSTQVTTSQNTWSETSVRQVPREVEKTWTETKVVPKTKIVSQDIYYRVRPGDTLIGIAHKLNIPDWKIIYAYNIWLQSDPRVSMLPKRYPGWWIFPGQNFRIPDAIMKQVTVYETITVQRKGTETVYDEVTHTFKSVADTETTTTTDITTDIEIEREETTSTTRNRFRSESVHRYDLRTVERVNSYAYFASIRDVIIAKTNWLNERDVAMFDFVDFEADGFTLTGVKRTEEGSYVPDGSTEVAEIISPVFKTVSLFRSIKILGVNKNSILRQNAIPLDKVRTYLPDNPQGSDLDQASWSDTDAKWDSDVHPWGSRYNKNFTDLVSTRDGDSLIIQGAEGAGHSAIIAESFKGTRGETVSGSIILQPLSALDSTARLQLMIVDLDTGETLSSRTVNESALTAGQPNTMQFGNVQLSEDRERLGLVVAFFDKQSVSYRVSAPMHTTGTIRFWIGNQDTFEVEDVSDAVGRLDGIYTFKEFGRNLYIRIQMHDRNDWASGLEIVPLYNPDNASAT